MEKCEIRVKVICMALAKKEKQSWLRSSTVRLARVHFLYVFLFAAQTIIYDAWKLIAPNAVLNRWIVTAILFLTSTVVWYLAKNKINSTGAYKALVFALIFVDIGAASFNVYTQRGMASRAVMLYAVPILVSAALYSRAAILATTLLSVAAYTTTAISYFVLNFNEGYKIELYGEVGFYSVLFFVLATLLIILVRPKKNHRA
ncbi:hypothetical protein HY003_01755 [Candidatus Saccharibacteria bacterium]|nr:hypothetical protein [Candidatus Saccharibacteria bacterium]MBI3338000.1 hypothetical protein [Candidatus Saccharibacteria bacterium]